MKTNQFHNQILVLVSALLLSTSLLANGNDPYFVVAPKGNKSLEIKIGSIQGKGKIQIQNAKGEIIFTEEIGAQKSLAKEYNFSQLPAGEYSLKVTDGFKVLTARIILSDTIIAEYGELYFLPVITQLENVLSVNKLVAGYEKLAVSVYDTKDHLLYSDVLSGTDFLGKRFDFTKAPKGTYKIYVAGGGHELVQKIEVK